MSDINLAIQNELNLITAAIKANTNLSIKKMMPIDLL